MPTYEYVCQSCGARFEAWQKMSDDPIDTCPTCGAHVRRVIFPVGLVFKGSGFYVNDTRSSSASAVPEGLAVSAEAKSSEPTSSEAKSPESTAASSNDSTSSSTSNSPTHSGESKASAPATTTSASE